MALFELLANAASRAFAQLTGGTSAPAAPEPAAPAPAAHARGTAAAASPSGRKRRSAGADVSAPGTHFRDAMLVASSANPLGLTGDAMRLESVLIDLAAAADLTAYSAQLLPLQARLHKGEFDEALGAWRDAVRHVFEAAGDVATSENWSERLV
jgi:hypothetical protein